MRDEKFRFDMCASEMRARERVGESEKIEVFAQSVRIGRFFRNEKYLARLILKSTDTHIQRHWHRHRSAHRNIATTDDDADVNISF